MANSDTVVEDGSQAIDRAARILVRLVESDDVVTLCARHGGHTATEVDGRPPPARPRAERPRAAPTRRRLPARTRARRVRATRLERRRPGHPGLAVPRAPRPDDRRNDERGDPDARWRRPGGPGQQQPPARSGQLGRQQNPDPRLVDGKGVHGVRSRPAAFRPPRKARAEHDHRPGRPARRARTGAALGYATTWEELDAGLCSTAAPVRGSRGAVIAAISVSAPTVRTSRERLVELAGQVVVEANALSDAINHYPGERGA